MIAKVQNEVNKLLDKDNSGHGSDHISRVLELSLRFAQKEQADKEVAALIALLHDVDDYKLFGTENAKNLTNAKHIMEKANVPEHIRTQVLDALRCIGYSKLLQGIRPSSIEGKVVSDADMCDALGVNGVLRVFRYSSKNGKPFFDRDKFPIENMTADEYTKRCADSSVCHIFEKILKLKDLMLSDAGKQEAQARHQIVVDILYHLFEEENAPEWTAYLDAYLTR